MPTLPNRAALGAASAKNTGSAQIGTPDYAAIVKIIYMKNGASFTTLDEAKTLAAWKTKVASKTIFPFPFVFVSADNGTEATNDDSALKGPKVIREGKDGLELTYDDNININKKLRALNHAPGQFFKIDANGNIYGRIDDAGKVYGYTINDLYTTNGKNPGENESRKFMTHVSAKYPAQIVDQGVVFKLTDGDATQIDGIYDVVGEVTNPAITGFDLSLTIYENMVPIVGMAKTDFVLKKASDSSVVTITTIADNIDGTTMHFTATLTAGTYNLTFANAVATVGDMAIELYSTPIVVTVPA